MRGTRLIATLLAVAAALVVSGCGTARTAARLRPIRTPNELYQALLQEPFPAALLPQLLRHAVRVEKQPLLPFVPSDLRPVGYVGVRFGSSNEFGSLRYDIFATRRRAIRAWLDDARPDPAFHDLVCTLGSHDDPPASTCVYAFPSGRKPPTRDPFNTAFASYLIGTVIVHSDVTVEGETSQANLALARQAALAGVQHLQQVSRRGSGR